MKTCLATVVTSRYIPYAQVLLRSLYYNSGVKDLPMYIIHIDKTDHSYNGIDHRKNELTPFYDNLIFKRVDYTDYIRRDKAEPYYWSIECFNIQGFDRVIFIDSDTMCMKSIEELTRIEIPTNIGMCWELARNQYNAGMFVINKPMICPEIYGKLMIHQKGAGTFGHDQAIYNEVFAGQFTKLPFKYNTLVDKVENPDDVHILHYIHKADTSGGKMRLTPAQYKSWYDSHDACIAKLKAAK
jgi:lipopolysaccharide biosynthesis glycosyltransferase